MYQTNPLGYSGVNHTTCGHRVGKHGPNILKIVHKYNLPFDDARDLADDQILAAMPSLLTHGALIWFRLGNLLLPFQILPPSLSKVHLNPNQRIIRTINVTASVIIITRANKVLNKIQ